MTRFIFTAAEMRAAEERAIAAGTPAALLMERAGQGVAEAVWRFAGAQPVLVLCGPGNNGGDGYVAARLLRERGLDVRVAALGPPKDGASALAAAAWAGAVMPIETVEPAPILIDALFGTGLSRGLDESLAALLNHLAKCAKTRVGVDLPSGVDTDTGSPLSEAPWCDLTVTFGTRKPAHLLQPAAARCGRVIVVDIGVPACSRLSELEPPILAPPGPEDHKFSRGYVAVLAGAMPGAASLAAEAAARSGAGYVRVIADHALALPHAIVQSRDPDLLLNDQRIGCVVIGPGLGRDPRARHLLDVALDANRALVIDGDGLFLLGERPELRGGAILTPHEGEFRQLFPSLDHPSKVERTRAAARSSGAVIVYKGPDTVIAAPDGRAVIASRGSPWLATAGTGDVLAGAIGAMRAQGLDAFAAAQAGVWLHAAAARRLTGPFIADDLLPALAQAASLASPRES